MSFLGKVNCGKQSVFAKETLGHNLQLPEGNAKSAQKTKGWEQMRMSLSICLLGRKGWLHVPLTSSGFRYRSRHNGKVGPFCFSRWQSCALGLISKHRVTHDIGTYWGALWWQEVNLLAHLRVQHPVDVLSSQHHQTVDLVWRKWGSCR